MVTKKEYRRKGISKGLLEYMLNGIKKMKPKRIWPQAQAQAQKFYEKNGFKAVSKPYYWDGIPHIDMIYNLK